MFEAICKFENLHSAYLKARKCKRYRAEILQFSYNLEENLLKLQQELLSQTYQHGEYREFVICDAKKRQIKAAPFRDRVVHHALCNIIEQIFDKGFIYDSYACRKNKGTHQAIKRLESSLRSVAERERERVKLPRQKFMFLNAIYQNILPALTIKFCCQSLRKRLLIAKYCG